MPCTEEICEERQNSLTGSPIPIAGDWDIAIGKESVAGATDIEFGTTRVRSHLTDSLLEYLGTAGEIVEQVDEDDVVRHGALHLGDCLSSWLSNSTMNVPLCDHEK